MSARELVKRYFIMIWGIIFTALGIILVTKANLGTSTVTSLPYVCSFVLPISLGTCMFIANLIFLAIQILINKGRLPKIQYLQLVMALLFSVCMDLMNWLLAFEPPDSYIMTLALVVGGCLVTAFGMSLEFQANVLILPADGVVREFAKWRNLNQGTVKLMLDCLFVGLAVIISLISFHGLQGVREGTIIAALLLGPLLRVYNSKMCFLNQKFFPDHGIELSKEME